MQKRRKDMKIRRWPYVIGTSVLFMAVTGCSSNDGTTVTSQGGTGQFNPLRLSPPTDSTAGDSGSSDAQVAADTVEADGILSDGTDDTDGSVGDDVAEWDGITESDAATQEEDVIVPSDSMVMMDAEEESMDAMEEDTILAEDTAEEEDTTEDEDISSIEQDANEVADVDGPGKDEFGACCTANFDCVDMDDAKECVIAGGTFEEGLSCAEDWPCPVPGFVGITASGRNRRVIRTIRRVLA
jgi:hypothetical protein